MSSFLNKHPFAVAAFFKTSLVLTYAVPIAEAQALLPPCLQADTFNDKWAFVAVAIVDTQKLRPKGFPEIMGRDFILAGYRLFARYHTTAGKRLRGLYILRSETDKYAMELLGNIFTQYKYVRSDIRLSSSSSAASVIVPATDFKIEAEYGDDHIALPTTSPFADWKEARRFAGPMPFTFSFDGDKNEVVIVEGVRQHWEPKPVHVIEATIPFIEDLGFSECKLANAFVVQDVPYYWKKGRVEQWRG